MHLHFLPTLCRSAFTELCGIPTNTFVEAEAVFDACYGGSRGDCLATLMIVKQGSMTIDQYFDTLLELAFEVSIADNMILTALHMGLALEYYHLFIIESVCTAAAGTYIDLQYVPVILRNHTIYESNIAHLQLPLASDCQKFTPHPTPI